MSLLVKREGQQCGNVAQKQAFFSPVPVKEFGDYVCKCHANDNEEFKDQYTVRMETLHMCTLCVHHCGVCLS